MQCRAMGLGLWGLCLGIIVQGYDLGLRVGFVFNIWGYNLVLSFWLVF